MTPGYWRRFRVGVLVHTFVQVFHLALRNEWMLIRIVVTDQHPHEEPQHADSAEHVENRGPAVGM